MHVLFFWCWKQKTHQPARNSLKFPPPSKFSLRYAGKPDSQATTHETLCKLESQLKKKKKQKKKERKKERKKEKILHINIKLHLGIEPVALGLTSQNARERKLSFFIRIPCSSKFTPKSAVSSKRAFSRYSRDVGARCWSFGGL